MRMTIGMLAGLLLAAPAMAGPPASSVNGIHPEAHAPVAQRERRPARRRIATLVNGRWRMTRVHVTTCKRRYKSYDPHTDRYHAYSGAYRRCVL